jgi:energy-coupling factor transporter ATP-binding protein EcfA2
MSMAGHRPGSQVSLRRSFFLFQEANFASGKEIMPQLVRRLSARGVEKRRARYMLDTWSESWGVHRFLRQSPDGLPSSVLQIFGLCELELCDFDAAVLDEPVRYLGPPVLEQATHLLLKIRENTAMLVLTALPTTLYGVADRVVTLSPQAEALDDG